MTTAHYNLFPNKAYLGHMVSVGTADDGKEIFNIFPVGGNPETPAEYRFMMGRCTGKCTPCTKCKLALHQLHPVRVA